MTGQTTSAGSPQGDRAGTVLHLCVERPAVLERFVRIAHSFGAELRQRDEAGCTVVFRGATVSAARAIHAACTVRDRWPADVRAVAVHVRDVEGESVQQLVRRLAALAAAGVVLLDEATADQATLVARVEHELDVQLPDQMVAEPMFRVGELLAAQPHRATVGRDAESRELVRRVQALSKHARGASLTVIAPAGHGKSHLADMAARTAEAEKLRCVRVHIHGFVRAHPGAAVASLLRALLMIDDAAALSRMASVDDLPLLMDALQMVPSEQAVAMFDAMSFATRRQRRLYVAADAVAVNAGTQAVLCIIEDLHWASEDMRALLELLVVKTASAPLLLLLTTRPEGRGTVAGTREIELGPLALNEARTLAGMHAAAMRAPWMVGTAAYLDDEELERLADVAQGSPLVIEQLAGAIHLDRTKMAATIDAVVRTRLQALEPDARDDAILAAALGEIFDREVVSRASGRPFAWQRLVSSGLVRRETTRARFSHALIRDAIYELATEPERRRAHERLAHTQRDDLILHARQLRLAGSEAAAAAYLEAARGEDNNARPDVALTLADEGLACAQAWPIRAELLLLKGQLKVGMGRESEALEVFEACRAGPLDAQARCRALIGSVSALRLSTSIEAALPLLDEVEALAQEHQLIEQLALAAHYRGCLLFARGAVAACGEQYQRAIQLAREAGVPRTEALALSGLADARYAEARIQRALDAVVRCIELARAHGLGRIEVANLFMVGALRALSNQPRAGLDDCLSGAELARKVGDRRTEMLSRLNAGMCLTPLGRSEEAAVAIAEAKRIAHEINAPLWAASIQAMEARNHVVAGHRDRARELAQSALLYAEAHDCAGFFGGVALGVLARATQGERRREAIAKGRSLLARDALSHNHFYFREDAIEASLEEGDLDMAETLVADVEAYIADEPIGRQRLIAERARAIIAARRGKGDPAALRRVLVEVRMVGLVPLAAAIEAEIARLVPSKG